MTVYFINEGLGTSNSGIEHAQFDRARVFRKNRVPFKIVTSTFNTKLHSILPLFAIKDSESVNLFDYFQKAESIQSNPMKVSDVDFGMDVEATKEGNTYNATYNGHFMGRIVVTPQDIVERVEYFDLYGNLYKVVIYDVRGFESLVQYYSPDNKIEVEVWLDVDGKPAIEKIYQYGRGENVLETWKIGNHIFRNLQEVRLHFYNELNKDGNNMFMIDRANVSEWQMTKLDKPAYIAFVIHNHQSSDSQNPNAALLNDNYEWMLANMDKWHCTISATPQQTHDIRERWGHHHTYFTVPVGLNPDIRLMKDRIPLSERKPYSMLVTARVAYEKGIHKMIEALAIAHKTIPELTLDIYGYVDHGNDDMAQKLIDEAMEKLENKDAVQFHGHTKDVTKLHEQHQLYLIFSHMEGFNIALMEAQSSGMVSLANNVNYGPPELVKDGENGIMVPFDDIDIYAEKMVELFSDMDKMQEMSDKAYDLSSRYSEDNLWDAWKEVLDDYEAWKQYE